MFKFYEQIFNKRGDLYNKATELCPNAREKERHELISRLNLSNDLILCDIPAGGGYVADGIQSYFSGRINVICLEPSIIFAKSLIHKHPGVIARAESIPLSDNSVDRVSSLAGLHHLPDKQIFFEESARILKSGGRIVVADVQANSKPAYFLNDAVDRLTETGHKGMFPQSGELSSRLEDAGFTNIVEELVSYTWDFSDYASLVLFCKTLFGMTCATLEQVNEEIQSALPVVIKENSAHLEWCLVFASGNSPEK